jgi:OmpA-OmpF porin, OOP family
MKFKYLLLSATLGVWLTSCASKKVDVDSVGGLREAKKVIEQAEKENADKFAPQTLKEAKASLDEAATVVYNNTNQAEVDAKIKEAQFSATRLLSVTRQAKEMSKLKPEELALRREAEFDSFRIPLKLPDQRGLDSQEQLANIQQKLDETAKLGAQASQLEGERTTQKKEIAALAQEKEFNEKFANAKRNFSNDEADVFRDGNQLVIRLKKMDFPSGKAHIPADNFVLLTKVQDTIKIFGEPSVIIEGHSDATGNAKLNRDLSMKRASAVKEYLVANGVVEEESVKVFGKGAEKPIASNQTPEGRAANRRIDLIIETEPKTAE